MPLAHDGFARRYRGARSFVESLYRILPGGVPTWHPTAPRMDWRTIPDTPAPGGKIPAQRVTQVRTSLKAKVACQAARR
jgi:hypothetical protein